MSDIETAIIIVILAICMWGLGYIVGMYRMLFLQKDEKPKWSIKLYKKDR